MCIDMCIGMRMCVCDGSNHSLAVRYTHSAWIWTCTTATCIDMCVNMCMYMYLDLCMDICINMQTGVCRDLYGRASLMATD